jgi:hypothetical protein
MSQPINDGGPAFPTAFQMHSKGMTLRDYFAADALHGLLALDNYGKWDELAKCSYRISDAMIKARESK